MHFMMTVLIHFLNWQIIGIIQYNFFTIIVYLLKLVFLLIESAYQVSDVAQEPHVRDIYFFIKILH